MKIYEQHPIGRCYPPLTDEQFQRLREVAKNNLASASPVYLYEGKILDGWHWYKNCTELGITPIFEEYTGTDPVTFVIRRHEGRRHLTRGQLAVIGEQLATMSHGGYRSQVAVTAACSKTRSEVAEEIGVSTRSMDSIRAAKKTGIPEIIAAAGNGHIAAEIAENLAKLPKGDQSAALEKAIEKKAAKNGAKKPRASRPPQQKPIVARPAKRRYLTPEEIGLPVNATMEEKDAHQKRYGRVQTQPKVIFDLREAETLVGSYVMALGNVISETHPEPEALLGYLDILEAWEPQPEKGEDYATNFAGKAKRFEALLDERLPIAVEQLTKLLSLWQERRK